MLIFDNFPANFPTFQSFVGQSIFVVQKRWSFILKKNLFLTKNNTYDAIKINAFSYPSSKKKKTKNSCFCIEVTFHYHIWMLLFWVTVSNKLRTTTIFWCNCFSCLTQFATNVPVTFLNIRMTKFRTARIRCCPSSQRKQKKIYIPMMRLITVYSPPQERRTMECHTTWVCRNFNDSTFS